MSEATESVWDRSAVHRAVRARHHHYTDVVDRLMREEAKLLPKGGDQVREQIVQMTATIAQIEKLGGDASAIKAARAELIAAREAHEPKLAEVQAKLAAARQCMKWADMAHEGMHWLCFAEPEYHRLVDCSAALNTSEG